MVNTPAIDHRKKHPGQISGAYLIGLFESFGNTQLVDRKRVPFDIDSLKPTGWYPYDYLLDTIKLTEDILPDSESFLFWAGTRFMELWYWHGPGKGMLSSGMDWVYANEQGDGYRSVAKGGTPEEIGWTKNVLTRPEEGFALVENVMPLSPEFLRGIYYGGFLLFDDMTYFDTEIYSHSIEPGLPFPKTVIKLVFRPNKGVFWDKTISSINSSDCVVPVKCSDGVEALWRIKHLTNLHNYREKHSKDLMLLLSRSLDELRVAKEDLQIVNNRLSIESRNLLQARDEADKANRRLTEIAVERSKQDERNKLLQDMHDGFGSQLTSARLMAESGRMTPDELPILLQECMADLYLMADTFSNPDNTLKDSLADLKFRVTHRTQHLSMAVRWRIDLDGMEPLPERDNLQILRITQEAINNALKHSNAKNMNIEATYERPHKNLVLKVSDDGTGMTNDFVPGRGLINMRRRADALGAQLSVLSNHPGTQVRLEIRFPADK